MTQPAQGTWQPGRGGDTRAAVTRGAEATQAVWTRDGQRLLFQWLTGGRPSLAVQPADGTASPQVLLPGSFYRASFKPDGRELAAALDAADMDIVRVTFRSGRRACSP